VAWTRNPQFVLSKPGKKSRNCHPSHRPPAKAGEAVATPPNMPSSAPSATITPSRLMAIPPSAPPHCGPVPGISSSRKTGRGGDGRHSPHYHPLGAPSTILDIYGRNLNIALTQLYLAGATATVCCTDGPTCRSPGCPLSVG